MRPSSTDPLARLGPLSEAGFNVLVALTDGPKHGYGMLMDIEARTGSQVGPGTLYAAIAALEGRRWIEPLAGNDPERAYQITQDGLQTVRARLADLATLTNLTARLADS